MYEFYKNAPESPDVDGWNVLVIFNIKEHIFFVSFFVFEEDVVEQLRAHVFWCGQLVLFKILEYKAWTIVDEFNLVFMRILKNIHQNIFGL